MFMERLNRKRASFSFLFSNHMFNGFVVVVVVRFLIPYASFPGMACCCGVSGKFANIRAYDGSGNDDGRGY